MRLLRRLWRWMIDALSVEGADGWPLLILGPGGDFAEPYFPSDLGMTVPPRIEEVKNEQ